MAANEGIKGMEIQDGSKPSSEDLASRKYIHWDDPNVEKKPANEDEDIQAVADLINQLQKAQYNMHRHCFSGMFFHVMLDHQFQHGTLNCVGTHARTQGVVKGTLVVSDDLPKHLKQSMFSRGGEYPVLARYSSEPGDPGLDDRIPQPRGFAMKVFNVKDHGPRFSSGVNLTTQDIEFNSTPALDLADAKTTREIIYLRSKYGPGTPEIYSHLEKRADCPLQKARDQVRNTHLESTRQYSQTAYRFGDYVAKYCLQPSSETQRKLYEETVKPDDADQTDILHRWLQNFHREHDAEYLLQFQLLENLDGEPPLASDPSPSHPLFSQNTPTSFPSH
ncbi:MAG: hypothetical protein Q9227_006473 [Pyrenula ochraceoflavens]